jgi:tetratricopeptide (TPR) repeat protein
VLAAQPPPPSKELDAEAHLERGLLYVQLRQYHAQRPTSTGPCTRPQTAPRRRGCPRYSQAIERNPQDAEAYHLRATHLRWGQGDKWDKAIDDHSQAIERAPQRLDLVVCRGMLYLRMGQKDKAAEDFRKFGGQGPDQANSLAWELATAPNLLHREPSLAVELARQAIRQAPREASYWTTLGVAHYRLGAWAAAIQALEEAEKLAPGKHLGFNAFFLAMCHHQLDDTARARAQYDRAVRWGQENQGKLLGAQQQELKAFR